MFKYVYNYFHSNDLFYKYQAGFLPGHSYLYQLIEIYDYIVKAIDKENIVVWFFVTCLKHLTVCGIRDFFLNYSLMA